MDKRSALLATLLAACAAEPPPEGEADDGLFICTTQPSISLNYPLAGGTAYYQGFPFIAADPLRPKSMVTAAVSALAPGSGGCTFGLGPGLPGDWVKGSAALYGSSDGGTTWTHSCAPWPSSQTTSFVGADVWWEGDPSVAFDRSGTVYAAYLLHAQQYSSGVTSSVLTVARSSDSGKTWTIDTPSVDGALSSTAYWATPRIAIDTTLSGPHSHPGRRYVAVSDNGRIRVHTWNETTQTWSKVPVSLPGPYAVAPSMKVAPDGTIDLVWTELDLTQLCSGHDATFLATSIDGGATWSAPTFVENHAYHTHTGDFCSPTLVAPLDPAAQPTHRGNSYSYIDIDGNALSQYYGRLYLATADYNNTVFTRKEETDIYLRHSDDGGATWTPRLRVNDDDPNIMATQFLPSLSVDPTDGSVSVAWLDTRNDTALRNFNTVTNPVFGCCGKTQVYTARSIDGGASFQQNRLLTDAGTKFTSPATSSDLWPFHGFFSGLYDPDPMGAVYNYGDFIGVAAVNRLARAVWTDTRDFYDPNNQWNVKDEDVANGQITYCSAPSFAVTPTVAKSNGWVALSWAGPTSWGIGACSGTYSVQRAPGGLFVGPWKTIAAHLTTTTYTEYPGNGSWLYRVIALNSCDGTALTAMSTTSNSVGVSVP